MSPTRFLSGSFIGRPICCARTNKRWIGDRDARTAER
jgi:hypothetical protein